MSLSPIFSEKKIDLTDNNNPLNSSDLKIPFKELSNNSHNNIIETFDIHDNFK